MKPLFVTAFAALTTVSVTGSASAQEVCMPTHEMRAALIDWYGERPVKGQDQGNTQLWVSDATGTWTILKTLSDGNSCVEAQGEDWMAGMANERIFAALVD